MHNPQVFNTQREQKKGQDMVYVLECKVIIGKYMWSLMFVYRRGEKKDNTAENILF